MSAPLFIDLGYVIDREGKKVPASFQTEQWQGMTEYVVVLGQKNRPNEPFLLDQFFDYLLSDGLSDFEILHEERSCLAFIPAGEIRALIRRLMAQRQVGLDTLSITAHAQVSIVPTPPPGPAFDPSDRPF
ncbi:hypothetical protein [Massilia pseudoviolaceinigra]|uniref:hypothetical protein n=1 Tax=Massilia pseudoviolaceinigra TaxID=3057165 RepID=UPI0027967BB9|nr:hypothetical protein [Massilia sp. CCM 9206]MDQ1924692.1 hypothetical protein [Massilia sp. CCM 9206]